MDKQSKPELQNTLMRAAFNTVEEGIISIDSQNQILVTNPEIDLIFGYAPLELVGKHIHVIMPEKYRHEHDAGLDRYLNTGVAHILGVRVEVEGLHKSGKVFPIELRISPTTVEGARYFTAAIRDISERKENEQRLEDQKTRLEKQNQQLARIHHFMLFTLDNMENLVQHSAEPVELRSYIAQVKERFEEVQKLNSPG